MTSPTSPLTPPAKTLVLQAPEPVEEITPEQIEQSQGQDNGFLPVVASDKAALSNANAQHFISEVSKLPANSPDFKNAVDQISSVGQEEFVKSSQGASRLLTGRGTSVASAKSSGNDAQVMVANTLGDLRSKIDELTPNGANLKGTRKILGIIPGGKHIDRYFQRYQDSQSQLDAIVNALLAGQDELRKDNASLEQEKVNLWAAMSELNEYSLFAKQLDAAAVAKIDELRSQGKLAEANAMDADVLFAIRQRHQDILTQLAVSVQGYLAMDLVQKNNKELIKGVDRARATTLVALRTAVMVAKALANQELVLNQISAINQTTNNMIEQTSTLLRQNTGRIQENAATSGVAVETLEKAFDDIFATMDSIDTFKQQANANMEKTIGALSNQLNRSRSYLERVQDQNNAGQVTQGNNRGQITS